MKLTTIKIRNFKGINGWTQIDIRPITIFLGANSSGKSSAIHALASLSQSLKNPNNTRPLVLDDELADVHLGRFIEVIHSREYNDSIGFELTFDDYTFPDFLTKKTITCSPSVEYQFKSTLRTQDIYLDKSKYSINKDSYEIRKSKCDYALSFNDMPLPGKCKTNGMFIDELSLYYKKRTQIDGEKLYNLINFQRSIAKCIHSIRYLGPFRQSPQRRYPTRGSNPTSVGAEGESAVTMLANEVVQRKSRIHLTELTKWMKMMGLGRNIEVQRVGKSDLFDLSIELSDGAHLSVADLGYGISQILPVITQCSFAPKESILLFEQPELHLHPKAAKELANVFVDVIHKKELTIIAETHSIDFFKRFIRQIGEGILPKDDFVAYKVRRENGESIFERLNIEDDNEIYSNFEEGITH